ncbi:hypothetical protein [Nocardia colli]|uniref:hypothetical protein n=1 Tax=Nocardia colli TaxID=2545717 RepID=UPI0035DD6272
MRNHFSAADLLVRVGISISLAVSGYLHADLYDHGYRYIHIIGPSFMLQAAASFALALVVLVGPWTLRAAAGLLAVGALTAFILSRTTGLFGFTEIGWQPAPQAALSVIAEAITAILCAVSLLVLRRRIPEPADVMQESPA